jgi:hypothetical protein
MKKKENDAVKKLFPVFCCETQEQIGWMPRLSQIPLKNQGDPNGVKSVFFNRGASNE